MHSQCFLTLKGECTFFYDIKDVILCHISYECFRKEGGGEIGHLPVNYALWRQAPLVAIVSVVQLHPKTRCPN